MTRKRKIQIGSLAAVLVLVLVGTTIGGYWTANKYRTNLEYSYRRSLSDLGDYVSSIETTLTKAVYTNTATQQNGVAARLMRDSSGAKASLSNLPLKGDEFENMSKFLAQVGDFSTALSNKISAGEKITPEEYQQIQSLCDYSTRLRQGLSEIQDELVEGQINIGETESVIKGLRTSQPVFSDKLETVAKDFEDYPKLIYDGPFSDHIGQQAPKMIEGKDAVAQGNAQILAAQFLGVDQSKLTHTTDNEGGLPTFNFLYGDTRVSITKAGGVPVRMMNPREIGADQLKYEDALKKATEFLNTRGFGNMKESYYVINDGKCTINFAYTVDGTVYYPDLIKVSVALDNGEVVELDATGFVMNHTNRAAPAVKLTQQQAQQSVSPYLQVKEGRLAIIPTPGLNEVTTYEFLCESKDEKKEQVLVYIDANKGFERDILILLFSDNGVLTQ
ncbi:germination protein YpeB [Clostridium minihomine]|uniref:germination protein YpeB n=1 Tax=Clostridium minihomine TaxID=2045012 RepID=UPI000C7885E3|nr:germination protein YpeB [Clostridium minihomine]